MSLRDEGLCASSQAQPMVANQQGSGLTAIDLNVWNKLVDLVYESHEPFCHEQKCCEMTNFDCIRQQESPSCITYSFSQNGCL